MQIKFDTQKISPKHILANKIIREAIDLIRQEKISEREAHILVINMLAEENAVLRKKIAEERESNAQKRKDNKKTEERKDETE